VLRRVGTPGRAGRSLANRTRYIVGFTGLALVAAFLVPAVPQPPGYHDFADHRAAFGIDNLLDVVSNVGFLFAAIAGIAIVMRPGTRFEFASERLPYAIFFVGMLLTAVGSAYYHLAPDNERLFWDRLPMTFAFMPLIAAQIVERINRRAGLLLLLPMLFVGAASVFYWRATERAGAGNVMPYAILQGYSVVILLLIAALQPSRYTRGKDIYWIFAAYVVAKVLELLDQEILALGDLLSGHTLKHLAAATAGFMVCRMLMLRRPLADPVTGSSP
jgi:hypothetical protein